MPYKVFDENGQEVPGVLSPEETNKILEEKKALEDRISNFDKENQTIKDQLEKLSKKDYDWKRLKDMNEAEKKELTAKEMELLKRQEFLEEKQTELVKSQQSFEERNVENSKKKYLDEYAGSDAEMRKEVLKNYDRIKDDAKDDVSVGMKMKEAMGLYLVNQRSKGNAFVGAINGGASNFNSVPRSATKLNDEQVDLARKLGISD